MWKSFTDRGKNKVYCLLLKDYKSIDEEHTEPIYGFLPWSAYDKYGLSMIWLFVNQQGDLVYSNTRWNHDADYGERSVDHAFSKEDISKIIGQSFDSIFKGYTDEELEEKGIINVTFDNCEEYIKKGYKLEQIFDYVIDCENGLFLVVLDNKTNYITPNGKLLSKTPFDIGYIFYEGFAAVKLNNGFYFINEKGVFLNKKPFCYAESFNEGFARVEVADDEWNFMKTDGSLLCKENFTYIEEFNEGFAPVEVADDEWNFMKTDGSLLCKKNFFGVGNFSNGFAAVVNFKNKWNYIDKHGKFLSNMWFDGCKDFGEKFALIKKNNLWNIINRSGKIVSDVWFSDYIYDKNVNSVKLIDTNNNKFVLHNSGLLINFDTYEATQLQLESRTNFIKKIIREELRKYLR